VLFERIETPGLAHYSYIIGDGREALVIDPRRDAAVYEHLARRHEMRVTTVLETHRNEDYVVGSAELAARTGATIWHADADLPYEYGRSVLDGRSWTIGRLTIEALATPGHTPGSMSYLLRDPAGRAWIVFTGDTLFAGDVGRVDLVDDRPPEEMAKRLHDSLFGRLLPLGDEIIVCPGHGAGSVCGGSIAERLITTIGLECRADPLLGLCDREEFVAAAAVRRHRPPYFRRVERLNLSGARLPDWFPSLPPLAADSFAVALEDGALVVDVRSEMAYGAAHVPGALSIWLPRLAQFAGSLLPVDEPLLLIGEGDDVGEASRCLVRLGYDDVRGYLAGGMATWTSGGHPLATTSTATVERLCRLLQGAARPAILDVRTGAEVEATASIGGAVHIQLVDLPGRETDVPAERPLYVFCGSGPRSMMAASLLERAGMSGVTVVLGGALAWDAIACELP